MGAPTTREVVSVVNIDCLIGCAWSDLQRLQRFIEKQLDNHRAVRAVAADVVAELDEIRVRLDLASAACRALSAIDGRGQ